MAVVSKLDMESVHKWLREEVWGKPSHTEPREPRSYEIDERGMVTIFNVKGDAILLMSKRRFDELGWQETIPPNPA